MMHNGKQLGNSRSHIEGNAIQAIAKLEIKSVPNEGNSEMYRDQTKILVVDDERAIRRSLQWTLEKAGHNVVTAVNGEEALSKISQLNTELVLLDIRMPGMSGIEVLKHLIAGWPDICVIMVTAIADTQTAIESMKLGAYDYITKPFDLDDVILKVREAVKKRDIQLKNKQYQLELQQRVIEQRERIWAQFEELLKSLAREHKLLYELASKTKSGKSALSRLPPELQEPIASIKEFRDALLRILRNGSG